MELEKNPSTSVVSHIFFSAGGGTTPYEAQLERKRQALRNALKGEFLRQRFHPNAVTEDGGSVFDAAVQRFISMKNTEGEYYYPTIKNFMKYAAVTIIPISIGIYFHTKEVVRCSNNIMPY